MMSLIHVSNAKPDCPTCFGSGVRAFMGYGIECYCTTDPPKPFEFDFKAAFNKFKKKEMKQIFAYTDSRTADADRYVEFLQAFIDGGGNYVFAIRNSKGETNQITVSPLIAAALRDAIGNSQ